VRPQRGDYRRIVAQLNLQGKLTKNLCVINCDDGS